MNSWVNYPFQIKKKNNGFCAKLTEVTVRASDITECGHKKWMMTATDGGDQRTKSNVEHFIPLHHRPV